MKGIIAAGLILAAATTMGQTRQTTTDRPCLSSKADYSATRLEKARKNFIASLNSENDGVAESALAQVTHMRAMLPGVDLPDIEVTVDELASSGRTPVIRYKAYLASLVFANPRMFSQETAVDYTSGDEFFTAIASRLQQTLLSHNIQ
jgi:hypothetical protein